MSRKNPGRPPLPKAVTKRHFLKFRLGDETSRDIQFLLTEKEAEDASELIRGLIFRARKRVERRIARQKAKALMG